MSDQADAESCIIEVGEELSLRGSFPGDFLTNPTIRRRRGNPARASCYNLGARCTYMTAFAKRRFPPHRARILGSL